MKIVVCVRQGLDGEINPFDASAYEEALRIPDSEVTLLSMGPLSAKDMLTNLTRLGAKEAVLLSDKAFAGADTLATAYTLSMAIKKLNPDLVFCGRQTLVGDTAQTGAMLSVKLGYSLITCVMKIKSVSDEYIACKTRAAEEETVPLPAVVTIERISNLRLPRLRSKIGECRVLSCADINADEKCVGLSGSPTRVISSEKSDFGKRKCKFIKINELDSVIKDSLSKSNARVDLKQISEKKLDKVFCIGEATRSFAESISECVRVIELSDKETLAEIIKLEHPDAVIWGSDVISKRISAEVAAMLNLGLCADCTSLETDGNELFMIRPALSGSVIAKIRSLTKPAMATVRTAESNTPSVIVGVGFGARNDLDKISLLANRYNGEIAATRKMVDNDFIHYEKQVGLTGKTVCPPVYVAVGISGAVHHIAGMKNSGTVIAINSDKNSAIFDYADYGIVDSAENIII